MRAAGSFDRIPGSGVSLADSHVGNQEQGFEHAANHIPQHCVERSAVHAKILAANDAAKPSIVTPMIASSTLQAAVRANRGATMRAP